MGYLNHVELGGDLRYFNMEMSGVGWSTVVHPVPPNSTQPYVKSTEISTVLHRMNCSTEPAAAVAYTVHYKVTIMKVSRSWFEFVAG